MDQQESSRDVRESGQVDLIAATQRQVQQVLQLLEHREAVGHQQGAVTTQDKSCSQTQSHLVLNQV